MAFRIGFNTEHAEKTSLEAAHTVQQTPAPRKSVVQVYFAERNMTLAYYNDRFDLRCGDMVYVDGKLEGMRGRVTEVNYNFKIKISDYKRVIAVADTTVSGRFFMAGRHFLTFDRAALPSGKVALWFKAPPKEEDEFISGSDESTFSLMEPWSMKVSAAIADRGRDYFMEGRVKYLCIDGTKGYAIVEGREAYEVEFEYRDGEIGSLTCSCFCSCNCKHEFAVMLQLQDMLELIEESYAEDFDRSAYFAAVNKAALFAYAVDGKKTGSFTL